MAWLHLFAHNALQTAAVSATPFTQFLLASRISDSRPWLQAFQKAAPVGLTINVATDFASGTLWIHAGRIGAGLAHQWSHVGRLSPIFDVEVIEAPSLVLTASLTNESLRVYGIPTSPYFTTFGLRFVLHFYV